MEGKSPADIGELLRRFRTRLGLTQEELAERVPSGVSVDTISNVERGRTRPQRHTLLELLAALGLDEAERDDALAAWRAAGRPASDASTASAPTHISAQPVSASLPAPPSALIGRKKEIEGLRQLLERGEKRLVTLTGPGGVGKTHLALAAAAAVQDTFTHGALFVDLSPLRDHTLVIPAIAHALGLRDAGDQPLDVRLAQHLRERHMLLVLDNFETVVEAGPQVQELVRTCPRLTALVTSRIALRVRGEQEHPLATLPLPAGQQETMLDELGQVASVALFVERAQEVAPDFDLTDQNASAVVGICGRLDGLPLALELAAAWTKLLPPDALLQRLDHVLDVLVDGPRDLPARQRTLRQTIDWSYALLTEEEQATFRRLAVFVGGWTPSAAEAVLSDAVSVEGQGEESSPLPNRPNPASGPSSRKDDGAAGANGRAILTQLARLADKSLLRTQRSGYGPFGGEPRFSMLETVREYAWERLVASGEERETRDRHARWCMALAEEAAPLLRGPKRAVWLRRLDAETDNFRAALTWCLQEGGDPVVGMRLAFALSWHWYFRGHFGEVRRWLATAAAHPAAVQLPLLKGVSLGFGSAMAWAQGDLGDARQRAEEAVTLLRGFPDERWLGFSLGTLALILITQGQPQEAVPVQTEAVALLREANDPWMVAFTLSIGSESVWLSGDVESARLQLQEGLETFQAIGDDWGVATVYKYFGYLTIAMNDYQAAREHLAKGNALFRVSEDRLNIIRTGLLQGYVALVEDDIEKARLAFAETLTLSRELGQTIYAMQSLAGCASLAAIEGRDAEAGRLFGGAAALLEDTNPFADSLTSTSRRVASGYLAIVRARMGPAAFAEAWAEGRALSQDEAVSLAMGVV
jgi:predicted ATPase/transcriptional regulator with XRE-family HTH domain